MKKRQYRIIDAGKGILNISTANLHEVIGITDGSTSGTCLDDFYVSNIHACSPLTLHGEVQSTTSTATGVDSFAFGNNTDASGDYSHAEGNGTTASGYASHAEGTNTTASTTGAHAEGNNTTASGTNAHAEGSFTTASGSRAHSEGLGTTASGSASHAQGDNTTASGDGSHAGGVQNTAFSYAETAIGSYGTTYSPNAPTSFNSSDRIFNIGNGPDSGSRSDAFQVIKNGTVLAPSINNTLIDAASNKVLITKEYLEANSGGDSYWISGTSGTNSLTTISNQNNGGDATGDYAVAFGQATTANGPFTTASGYYTTASSYGSFATGGNTTASNSYAAAFGQGTVSSGNSSFAEGINTTASEIGSHAEGGQTTASGYYSHAEGKSTEASGHYSHAEGSGTTASARYAHAEGFGTTASSYASHAEGGRTTASGYYSHAEGRETQATGLASHAEGSVFSDKTGTIFTVASGQASHAEGQGTTASGLASHSQGLKTTASGDFSHAEGNATSATTIGSHAEGLQTIASGSYSHAEGNETVASNSAAHAEGDGTTAAGQFSHAEGRDSIANGQSSHAEGNSTVANGVSSHAGGVANTAFSYGERAVGIYGTEYTPNSLVTHDLADRIFNIGIGPNSFARADAFQVIKNGTVLAPSLTTSLIDAASNKVLITKEYLDANGGSGDTLWTGGTSGTDSLTTISNRNNGGDATGNYAVAFGRAATASGLNSTASGYYTTASGDYSHTEGAYTTASGGYSHAEGTNTTASGGYSHAEGNSTTASSYSAHAEGGFNTASGAYSHAGGRGNEAFSYAERAIGTYGSNYIPTSATNFVLTDRAFNIGNGTSDAARSDAFQVIKNGTVLAPSLETALIDAASNKVLITKEYANANYASGTIHWSGTGTDSITTITNLNNGGIASGQFSTASGYNTTASGNYGSHAEGNGTTASGYYGSHAEGQVTLASGESSHAEGSSTTASGFASHAQGQNSQASGESSHAEGSSTTASGFASHAQGQNSQASGTASHAEGLGTTASGTYSHSEGQGSTASGTTAHAEGRDTVAGGTYSHAEGWGTQATDLGAHAEGKDTTASGRYSHSEGIDTTASGFGSHAEGRLTIASSNYAHAEGRQTTASAFYTHSEGYQTTASDFGAHAQGEGTIASGRTSHAQGTSTIAGGDYSHAGGIANTAYSYAETSIGYNGTIDIGSKTTISPTDRLFNIGNGNSPAARSDAFQIIKNGTVLAPSLTTSLIDSAGSNKVLITKEYGDANYSATTTLQIATDNGNNTTNDIVIDPLGTTTNIAGSLLTVKNSPNASGINATEFIDVNRTSTTPCTSNTIASVFRSIHAATVFNNGTTGFNAVGRYTGTGGGEYVYGGIINAEHNGSGNLDFLIPLSQKAEAIGTGVGTIDFIRGSSPQVTVDNPNITVNFAQGMHPSVAMNDGTIGTAQVLFLDFDHNGNTGVTVGDLAYIRAGNDSLPTITGTSYFIKSESVLPSEFDGTISTDVTTTQIDNATDKVLTTKEWINDNSFRTLISSTGATKTLALSDENKSININNASPNTLEIPLNSSVAFTIGTEIRLINSGSGTVTVNTELGVTLIDDLATTSILTGGVRHLQKIDTDTWVMW